jgi:hypothetical protein
MQTNEETNRQGQREILAKGKMNGEYLDRKTSIHSYIYIYRHRLTDGQTERKTAEHQTSVSTETDF